MLKRIGKRGPFLACSGFPKCRNIKKYVEKDEPKPPEQGGGSEPASSQ
jgi:DNA topoisomerase-1